MIKLNLDQITLRQILDILRYNGYYPDHIAAFNDLLSDLTGIRFFEVGEGLLNAEINDGSNRTFISLWHIDKFLESVLSGNGDLLKYSGSRFDSDTYKRFVYGNGALISNTNPGLQEAIADPIDHLSKKLSPPKNYLSEKKALEALFGAASCYCESATIDNFLLNICDEQRLCEVYAILLLFVILRREDIVYRLIRQHGIQLTPLIPPNAIIPRVTSIGLETDEPSFPKTSTSKKTSAIPIENREFDEITRIEPKPITFISTTSQELVIQPSLTEKNSDPWEISTGVQNIVPQNSTIENQHDGKPIASLILCADTESFFKSINIYRSLDTQMICYAERSTTIINDFLIYITALCRLGFSGKAYQLSVERLRILSPYAPDYHRDAACLKLFIMVHEFASGRFDSNFDRSILNRRYNDISGHINQIPDAAFRTCLLRLSSLLESLTAESFSPPGRTASAIANTDFYTASFDSAFLLKMIEFQPH